MIRALLAARGSIARLGAAGVLLWVLAADTPARLERMRYASLPDQDFTAEIAHLRSSGRFGEAIAYADAAIALESGAARSAGEDAAERIAALRAERARAIEAQGSYLRRAKDLGLGALSGSGGSLEGLVGAVAADFFVVGDVRDLIIQGGRLILDGEADEVILLLSGVGLATTLAPEVDWVPSILKAARRAGTMTRELGGYLVRTMRAGRFDELGALLRDVRALSRRASPGGAARLLAHVETPADAARLARFVERQPAGALALHVTGREGAALLKAAESATPAVRAAAEQAVVLAARKGPSGSAWLRTGAWRTMLRPHAVVGVVKAFSKGNAERLVQRIAAAIDPRARWLIPLVAAWVFVEAALLWRRFRGRDARPYSKSRPWNPSSVAITGQGTLP